MDALAYYFEKNDITDITERAYGQLATEKYAIVIFEEKTELES